MIEFLLNNKIVRLADIDPNTTVLEYLRDQQRVGTKEGCASGDCGACTVVTAELDTQQQLSYKNINACITFIGAMHGKQLITIEDLKSGNNLHSTQLAMVDTDGSQCGFCTPGFVMSLFSLQKHQKTYDRATVQQSLAGNLCRCTGYKAIDNAAQQALTCPASDQFDAAKEQTKQSLKQISSNSEACPSIGKNNNICHLPQDAQSLADLLIQYPQCTLVAGSTDLAIEVTQNAKEFNHLISTAYVSELKQTTITEQQISIGAAVTLNQCQHLLHQPFPDFASLLERFASLQVRNQGTLAGNIANASPIGDTPPALIALNAHMILRCANTQRSELVEDFVVDYRKTTLASSEFIEKIVIPIPQHDFHFKIYKVSKRLDDDISAICVANYLCLDAAGKVSEIRLAYGGMAAIAKRAVQTEAALLGKTWNEANIEAALLKLSDDFQPLSDFRASNQYRMLCAQNLLRKFFYETPHSSEMTDNTHLATDIGGKMNMRISDYV
ncbi:MAG: xanthine dehydrogenase small subunit [Oceanospirillaceae bacterium]|nr:xanthine dehydrogenase small subunit [Oceanospirillaceae bacterium]